MVPWRVGIVGVCGPSAACDRQLTPLGCVCVCLCRNAAAALRDIQKEQQRAPTPSATAATDAPRGGAAAGARQEAEWEAAVALEPAPEDAITLATKGPSALSAGGGEDLRTSSGASAAFAASISAFA